MNHLKLRQGLSLLVGLALLSSPAQPLHAYQTAGTSDQTSGGTDAAPSSTAELQALVAPIALYPDSLVAQILTGSTYPDEIAIAEYWLQQNSTLTGSALMQAVDKQTWDPSVKALTQFPSVLENMAKNLSWTSSLGEAYHNQQAEVMTAIQTLRAQAKAKGNLKTTSQITVVQQAPQTIVIQPTNPQIVYVPQYNPTIVYGTTYVIPAGYVAPVYTTGDVVAAGLIGFGAGIAVGAMMSGGCCGWGYSSWSCGWHGTAVVYHGGAYYGNSAWHGGYYNGGYHNNYGYNSNYARNNGNTYNRNISGNTVNVNKQSAQSFQSNHSSGSNSWAQHSNDFGSSHSNAFSGMGGSGSDGRDSWSSRSDSSRGWGSMHSSGFSGGRFGGGGGGFGGGRWR
jgi:hypothetical protein